MKKIPPVDLARQYKLISEEIATSVLEILSSGRYIGGTAVAEFEEAFANYIGVSQCISCNSGTDALYLGLQALGIGHGDEVITTPFTFFATAEVISRVGAVPVFVDIDANTFNVDVHQIEAAITNKTKAIMPVHLFGQPVDMTKIMSLANQYHLFVIEDCAQATGGKWHDQQVGSIGHLGCFSFFPTKNLGSCGDGGALTTNDPAIARSLRMLKEHGSSARYLHEAIGLNSRLDAIQAGILQIKLRYLDDWNEKRRQVATLYHELLEPIPGIKLPQELLGSKSVWNQYTICLKNKESSRDCYRDQVRSRLEQLGILSMIYYPIPLHLQPVYQNLNYDIKSLPVAKQVCDEVLSLPMFPDLSFAEQEQVAYALKESLNDLI